MKKVVDRLKDLNKTVATMESCTGGFVASSITDIEGASDVLKFSAVTYSNEYKIKMGVSSEIIDKYSVYSKEVAREIRLREDPRSEGVPGFESQEQRVNRLRDFVD